MARNYLETPWWQALVADVANKRVLIFGLGRQGGGVQVANTLKEAGALVRVSDQLSEEELEQSIQALDPDIEVHVGRHDIGDLDWAELIVKNPAVPYEHPQIQEALSRGIPVVSETMLTLNYLRDRTIGVTGTRGKTTTSHLIHHILVESGRHALLGGNLPQHPALSLLRESQPESWFVLEMSSFQLEAAQYLPVSPHVAVITNISHDHLNRYPTMEDYTAAKGNLFAYQKPGDHAFWGSTHAWAKQLEMLVPEGVAGHALSKETLLERGERYRHQLLGGHNQENIGLAAYVADALEIPEEKIEQAVASFRGVPYRLETIAVKHGIRYINDTTATTPTALQKALEALAHERFVLIAGGTTKHLPIPDELTYHLRRLPQAVVWLDGTGTEEILAAGQLPQDGHTRSIQEAIDLATTLAQKRRATTVVLSPGFSSFELFRNEFDRGDQFNEHIRRL